MTAQVTESVSQRSLTLLSRLLLQANSGTSSFALLREDLEPGQLNFTRDEFAGLVDFASSNHVNVRGLEVYLDLVREGADSTRSDWAENALASERARIETALSFLGDICAAFHEHHYKVAVIKSLDHWPDLGSDLDLYTDAKPHDVCNLMMKRFGAQVASRSWGDRLAHKWNFLLPGLPEAVEIHIGRLGQTGEQVAVAKTLLERTQPVLIGGHEFRVPSFQDRLMISTLQRMYRHFYFRLCDVVDSARLMDSGAVDFRVLRSSAQVAGIWEGVATYLAIVSDYVERFRGFGLGLPRFVLESARFRGDLLYLSRGFLRVPIMPESARLYGTQLAGVLARRELRSGARLSLLPWLATAALVGQKLTGSDKGIW
ncbi:MAG: nucleotidyltransferase family protein [Terracidiphilus sp.]